MNIIDAHSHTEFRSANDYWFMSMSGVSTVVNPSTFSGLKKRNKVIYHDYFERQLDFETWRAAKNGINLFIGIGVDPEDFEDVNVALEVLDEIPDKYFSHERCCCLGEIGLHEGTEDEQIIFRKQLEIVGTYKIPAIIHTPQVNQLERINQLIDIVNQYEKEYPYIKEYLLLDELIPENIDKVIDTGFSYYGIPVSPQLDSPFVIHRKANGDEILDVLNKVGGQKVILNSALAWGYGDGLALPKIKNTLQQKNVDQETIDAILTKNAIDFFNKWRKIV